MNTNPNPLNPRQKKFADLFITGTPAGHAWTRAGYQAKGNAAEVLASQALKKPKFRTYIKAERSRLEKIGEFERNDLVTHLVAVIRTPIGGLDENSPLVQELHIEQVGENITRTKIKMSGKLEACKQLAAIMGWNKPSELKVDLSEKLSDIISRIRSK